MKLDKLIERLRTATAAGRTVTFGIYEAYALNAHLEKLEIAALPVLQQCGTLAPDRIAELEADCDKLRGERAVLEHDLDKARKESAHLEEVGNETQARASRYQADRDKYRVQRDEARSLVEQLNQRNAKLTQERTDAQAEVKVWRETAKDRERFHEAQLGKVANERNEARDLARRVSADLARKEAAIEAKNKELSDSYEVNARQAQELEKANIFESKAVDNIAGVANERSEKIRRLERDYEKMREERDAAKAVNSEYFRVITEQKAKIAETKAQLEDVQIMLHSAVEQRDQALAQTEHYREDNAGLVDQAMANTDTSGALLPSGTYDLRQITDILWINGIPFEAIRKDA